MHLCEVLLLILIISIPVLSLLSVINVTMK